MVLHRPGLQFRDIQHVVDQRQQVRLYQLHAAKGFSLLLGDGAVDSHLDQLHMAGDGVQRRAQLV